MIESDVKPDEVDGGEPEKGNQGHRHLGERAGGHQQANTLIRLRGCIIVLRERGSVHA